MFKNPVRHAVSDRRFIRVQAWAEFLVEPGLLGSKLASRAGRIEHWEEIHGLVARELAQWTNLDLMRETMPRRRVIGPFQKPYQVLESPHLEETWLFAEIDHAGVGLLKCPGPGLFVDGENAMASARPAPDLAEHSVEFLCGELGLRVWELGLLPRCLRLRILR